VEGPHHTLEGGTLRYSVSEGFYNSKDSQWLYGKLSELAGFDLQESENWERIDRNLADRLRGINSICDTQIQLQVDKKTFSGRNSEKVADGSYCVSPLDILEDLCLHSTARRRVAARIRTLKCVAKETQDSAFVDLNPSELVYAVGTNRSTELTKNTKWLESHLK
jgi:hypothetical protein